MQKTTTYKNFTFIIILFLLVVMLGGCVSADVKFKRDGSGSAVITIAKTGFSSQAEVREKLDAVLKGVDTQSRESGRVTIKSIRESGDSYIAELSFKRISGIQGLGYFMFSSGADFGSQRAERMRIRDFAQGSLSLKGSNYNNSTYTILDDEANSIKPIDVASGQPLQHNDFLDADYSYYTEDNTIFTFVICGFEFVEQISFTFPGTLLAVSDKNLTINGDSSVTVTPIDVRADVVGVLDDGITSFLEKDIPTKAFAGYVVFENADDHTVLIVLSVCTLLVAGALFAGFKTGFFRRFFAGKKFALIKKHRVLYLFVLPGFVLMFLFNYLPMAGIIVAFKNYTVDGGIFGSEWVGIRHFVTLFTHPGAEFWLIFRNTVVMAFLKFVFGFPSSIILALMFNALRSKMFKKTVQTISYLPYFISWVVVSNISYILLTSNGGVINNALAALNIPQVRFYSEPKYWWGILTFTSVWKNIGWGTIIYLAAITGINPDLYEAASIDGAGPWQKLWKVTLPSMMPVIGIQLILNAGALIKDDFDQIFTMVGESNYTLRSVTEVFSSLVYRQLKGGVAGFSSATAVSLVQSVISLGLVLISNRIVRKTDNQGLW